MQEVNELYSRLIDENYFTEEELSLVTCINGYTVDTLNDCIYARYGYHTYEQLKGE
ncbi:MAG: hypothetical protein KBS91_04170 [Firmicutes bacterium]|nr:hypothetical protein [Candidatus Caballimonas caccae]